MKKISYLLTFLLVMAFAVACESNKPDEPDTPSVQLADVTTYAATDISTRSVVLHGRYTAKTMRTFTGDFMIGANKQYVEDMRLDMFWADKHIGRDFQLTINFLSPATRYYYRAGVMFDNRQGLLSNLIEEFETLPLPLLPNHFTEKAFSVAPNKQVSFSPGNLQYHARNNEWRFAERQYIYIGDNNLNISQDYDGWIDLFGWGTGDCPTKNGIEISDYTTFVDWASNQIGDDAPNTWRTLTIDEWRYLLYTRDNANSLIGLAQVNSVIGLILLPDNWEPIEGVTFVSAVYDTHYESYQNSVCQTYTDDQWALLEQSGAVFLPHAGVREYSYYDKCPELDNIQNAGYYASSTNHYKTETNCLCMGLESVNTGFKSVYYGLSVRLVKEK